MTISVYDDPVERAARVVAAPGLRVVDLAVGAFGVVLPICDGPVFFRLARPAGGVIDQARALYLLVANGQLHSGTGGWIDGPGIAIDCKAGNAGNGGGAGAKRAETAKTRQTTQTAGGRAALRAEIEAVAPAIRALGEDERFARVYLELHDGVATAVDDASSQAGSNPDLSITATHTGHRRA